MTQMLQIRRSAPRGRLGVSAVLVACGALLLGPMVSSVSAASEAASGVIPPGSSVGGQTYSQWSANWWRWQIQSPNSPPSNPNVDPNPGTPSAPEPVDCTADQSGQVWFLAGTSFAQSYSTAFRSCTIPSGKFLFFPVVDAWNDNLNCPANPPGTLTAQQLASNVQQLEQAIIPGSMSVTIDGVAVPGLQDSSTAFQAAANGFSYTLPAKNLLSLFCPGNPFPGGTKPPPPGAFANGVYIMLGQLSAGVHQLHWTAQVGPNNPFGAFSQDITYTLNVKA